MARDYFSRAPGEQPSGSAAAAREHYSQKYGPCVFLSFNTFGELEDGSPRPSCLTFEEAKGEAKQEQALNFQARRRRIGLATVMFRESTGGKAPRKQLATK